jgi:hypothetical protein
MAVGTQECKAEIGRVGLASEEKVPGPCYLACKKFSVWSFSGNLFYCSVVSTIERRSDTSSRAEKGIMEPQKSLS